MAFFLYFMPVFFIQLVQALAKVSAFFQRPAILPCSFRYGSSHALRLGLRGTIRRPLVFVTAFFRMITFCSNLMFSQVSRDISSVRTPLKAFITKVGMIFFGIPARILFISST